MVYFAERLDGLVKIGWTTGFGLTERVYRASFVPSGVSSSWLNDKLIRERVTYARRPVRLLGIILNAGRTEEAAIHRQFDYLARGRELFSTAPELLAYIFENDSGGFDHLRRWCEHSPYDTYPRAPMTPREQEEWPRLLAQLLAVVGLDCVKEPA